MGLSILLAALLCGCAATVRYPELGLQRTLLPGLGNLEEDEIRSAFKRKIEVVPPASAGLAWLTESAGQADADARGVSLSEFQRTGVINATLEMLRHEPFSNVTSLPTVDATAGGGAAENPVLALRSAAAHFQVEIAILMQTGSTADRGFNAFALGFIGLITAPLFPGVEVAVASSAELCAVDVRSGIMIACARGRSEGRRNYVFLTREARVRNELAESTVRDATVAAAHDLLSAVANRLAQS